MDFFSTKLLFALILSFAITHYLIPIFCAIARKLSIVDQPDGNLKKQKEAVPYLGGLAIYAGLVVTLLMVFPFASREILLVLISTLLLSLGLVDDLVPMKPAVKLAGQAIAATCFVNAGFCIDISVFPWWISATLSFVWFLTIINAFNLVDVMDGLATSLAIATAFSFFVFASMLYQLAFALLLVSMIGALFAFFLYNRYPARIYLGDSGSMFIGSFLAGCPFFINWAQFGPYGTLIPIIFLAIPLLEIAQLITIRVYKRIPFWNGSPDHFCHMLMRNGWSKVGIIDYMFAMSLLLLIGSYWFAVGTISLFQLIVLGLLFLCIWIFFQVKKLS